MAPTSLGIKLGFFWIILPGPASSGLASDLISRYSLYSRLTICSYEPNIPTSYLRAFELAWLMLLLQTGECLASCCLLRETFLDPEEV